VVTDIKMPGIDGIEVLTRIKEIEPTVPGIIMTGYASMETAIEAVNKGAYSYLRKQTSNDEIKQIVKKAIEMRWLQKENKLLKQSITKASGPTVRLSRLTVAPFLRLSSRASSSAMSEVRSPGP